MITVRDLGWKYAPLTDGSKPVESLKRVSFDIRSGSFVGIIGPTGAGKSTLIKGLLGLKAPEQGSITLGDGQVHAMHGIGRHHSEPGRRHHERRRGS